jgi:hypothetical protein
MLSAPLLRETSRMRRSRNCQKIANSPLPITRCFKPPRWRSPALGIVLRVYQDITV